MMQLPNMLLVRQNFPDLQIHNIPAAVQQQMNESALAERMQLGARIAIGVGSRGINNIPVMNHGEEKRHG